LKRLCCGLDLGHHFITIDSRPVHVRFVVDKVVLGPVPPSDLVLPCQYYSNNVPYSSENKWSQPRNLTIRHCCCGNLREVERNVLYVFIYLFIYFIFSFFLVSVGLSWITSNWL
jgi:hypothetical protein